MLLTCWCLKYFVKDVVYERLGNNIHKESNNKLGFKSNYIEETGIVHERCDRHRVQQRKGKVRCAYRSNGKLVADDVK